MISGFGLGVGAIAALALVRDTEAVQTSESKNDSTKADSIAPLEYSLKSTILPTDDHNDIILSNYFGSAPLCYDSRYLTCLKKAKASLHICSVNNKACQCYVAGSSIIECSKFCPTYDLNNFLNFKTHCEANPYVLNYDEKLYQSYDSKHKDQHSLINELHKYRNIVPQAKYFQNSSTPAKKGQNESKGLSHPIFDFSLIDDTTRQFERNKLGYREEASPSEPTTFLERENLEREKIEVLREQEKFEKIRKETISRKLFKNHTSEYPVKSGQSFFSPTISNNTLSYNGSKGSQNYNKGEHDGNSDYSPESLENVQESMAGATFVSFNLLGLTFAAVGASLL